MARLVEGNKAPLFKIPNQKGKTISLKDLLGKWVILYFYPKDMTPGCTQEAIDFSNIKKSPKIVILGVSKDSVKSHDKFAAKYDLKFDLVADEDLELCKDYGVYKKKSLYGREYMGIERTTFVIDPKGKVAKIYPKVKVKDHAQDVFEFIKSQTA
jgi:peroxiredoxin Q/BCP